MSMLMKNKAVSVSRVAVPALLVLLVGCTRCEDCTLNGNTETICETEFDSPAQYEDAVADREADGAQCVTSGGY